MRSAEKPQWSACRPIEVVTSSLLRSAREEPPGVPSRESNSGLSYIKPTHYQLSHAAPEQCCIHVCIHVVHCCEITYNDNIKNLPHPSCTIFSKNIFGKRHYDIHFQLFSWKYNEYAWPLSKQTTENKNVFYLHRDSFVFYLFVYCYNTCTGCGFSMTSDRICFPKKPEPGKIGKIWQRHINCKCWQD